MRSLTVLIVVLLFCLRQEARADEWVLVDPPQVPGTPTKHKRWVRVSANGQTPQSPATGFPGQPKQPTGGFPGAAPERAKDQQLDKINAREKAEKAWNEGNYQFQLLCRSFEAEAKSLKYFSGLKDVEKRLRKEKAKSKCDGMEIERLKEHKKKIEKDIEAFLLEKEKEVRDKQVEVRSLVERLYSPWRVRWEENHLNGRIRPVFD